MDTIANASNGAMSDRPARGKRTPTRPKAAARSGAPASGESLEQAAARVVAALRAGEKLPDGLAQDLLAASVVAYGARRQSDAAAAPFTEGHGVTATDVAVTATAMLEVVNIAIFELGLWQTMARNG